MREVADVVSSFRYLDELCNITSRRAVFFLPYGEDGDDGLDQTMGTKVERRTNIEDPAL